MAWPDLSGPASADRFQHPTDTSAALDVEATQSDMAADASHSPQTEARLALSRGFEESLARGVHLQQRLLQQLSPARATTGTLEQMLETSTAAQRYSVSAQFLSKITSKFVETVNAFTKMQ